MKGNKKGACPHLPSTFTQLCLYNSGCDREWCGGDGLMMLVLCWFYAGGWRATEWRLVLNASRTTKKTRSFRPITLVVRPITSQLFHHDPTEKGPRLLSDVMCPCCRRCFGFLVWCATATSLDSPFVVLCSQKWRMTLYELCLPPKPKRRERGRN
jgi:hypothetical protein